MISEPKDDYVLIFEAPKIEPPEFRLYYDKETGNVLFYTCEKPEGTYIVVDNITFACARHDIKVIDGRISTVKSECIVNKLVPGDTGITCLKEDVSIIVAEKTDLETQTWKLGLYELR